ncbi:MAG: hypothetical protein J4F30_06545 [Acidobacteria bacterium]|nr:hypothetical protein [Acidobacteriota bacterium]
MSLVQVLGGAVRHSMRAYYLPLAAGFALATSAFMPWILMGEQRIGGLPSPAGFWVLGLGLLAVLLAVLSFITRKNSRHPLLLVGLAAFAILLTAERLLERSAAQQAWARSQANAIVGGDAPAVVPDPVMASGAWVGLSAAAVIALFGLTIVVRRAAQPYAEPEDDDA